MFSDSNFGPQAGSSFDFTLLFDHTVLSIVPSALMIIVGPLCVLHYRKQIEVVLASPLLWSKLAVCASLFGMQIGSLVVWVVSQHRRTTASVAAATLACIASIVMAVLLNFEHRFSMSSSAFMSVWLVVSLLCDGATARSYFLRGDLHDVASLIVCAAVFKLALVILEEWPKTQFVKDNNTGKPVAREATGGFWNRALILWLNKTLFSGYRFIIAMDDLDELDPKFQSEALSIGFHESWGKANKNSKFALAKTCLWASLWEFLGIIPPRLCYSFFMFVQPFYLDAAVSTFQESNVSAQRKGALLGAAALIYLGVAITRSVYTRMNTRLATIIRGMLIAAIYTKIFDLDHNRKELGSAVTHMSTDIDGITTGVVVVNEAWINYLEVAFGIYLLATMVGKAAFLVAIPVLVTTWLSRFLGTRVPDARAEWHRKIDVRVSTTSVMLSQLKSLKMVGLDTIASNQIRVLRKAEIHASIKSRMLMVITAIGVSLCNVLTPTVVLAGALFWTTFTGTLTPVEAFKTIAIVFLVADPMEHSLKSLAEILSTLACAGRIQAFLLIPIRNDPRSINLLPNSDSVANEKNPLRTSVDVAEPKTDTLTDGCVVEFHDAYLAPTDVHDKITLFDINITIKRGEFVMISGPVGCGKSIFLQSILGDVQLIDGSIIVKPGRKGWCGQTIWIQNVSIKQNIVGHSPPDDAWYNSVIDACQLRQDLERMPLGDESLAGSNGANLSGGQKQRVAIARALFSRSEVLLFDDIFSSLDEDTVFRIFAAAFGPNGLIQQWNATVILVSHNMDLFYRADRVILIDSEGAVVMHDDLDDAEFRSQLKETIEKVCEEEQRHRSTESVEFSPLPKAKGMVPSEAENGEQAVRQRGDLRLYLFFLRTVGMIKSCFWLVFTAVAMVIEKFPEVFLRIWLDNAPDRKVYFLGYALISYISTVTSCGQIFYWHRFAMPGSLETMHELLLDALMSAKLSFLTKTDNGTLLNHFSGDMTLVSQTFPQMFMRTVASFFYMLMGLVIILTATRYTAAFVPPLLLVLYFVQRFYLRTSRQMRHIDLERKTPIYTQLTEIATGLQYIRALGWEQSMLGRGMELLDLSQRPYYQMFTIQRWLGVVMDLLVFCVALVILGVSLNLKFTATEASLALGLVTLLKFSDDLARIISDWTNLETSVGALARIREFIEKTPKQTNPSGDAGGIPDNWPASGHINIQNLVARYSQDQGDRPILKGISVNIPHGTKVGIVGRTGSGKSSLLLAMLNFLDYSGSIVIDGVDISRIPLPILRTRITTLSQDSIKLDGSIFDNLCPWDGAFLEGDAREQRELTCADVLDKLGLWEKVIATEDGLNANASKMGFSKGEEQLLGIARSIIETISSGTKVVFVDEATSNLDWRAEYKVHKAIHDIFSDCTVLIVSHRTAMLRKTQLKITIDDGKIASITTNQRTSEEIQQAGPSRPTPQPIAEEETSEEAGEPYLSEREVRPEVRRALEESQHRRREQRVNALNNQGQTQQQGRFLRRYRRERPQEQSPPAANTIRDLHRRFTRERVKEDRSREKRENQREAAEEAERQRLAEEARAANEGNVEPQQLPKN